MKIIIIHPSGFNYGSGFYIQCLAEYFNKSSQNVMIWSEGPCSDVINGVQWRQLKFNGSFLSYDLISEAFKFKPDIILEVGVRSKPIRAALEIVWKLRIPLIVQAEDDEYEPFIKHSTYTDFAVLDILNKPKINLIDILLFFRKLDIRFTLKVLANPYASRWVEPLFRIFAYKLAIAFGCIWYPMQQRLQSWFEKPTFIIPPVVNADDLRIILNKNISKEDFLTKWGIDSSSFIIFISGTIYSYSKEYQIFLESLKSLSSNVHKKITLVVAGKNASLKDEEAKIILGNNVDFVNLNLPSDEDYHLMVRFADLNASPGIVSIFNKYRLSSRLVKALILGRPIFTFKTGLGEYMNGIPQAYLTEGNNKEEWASLLSKAILESRVSFHQAIHDYGIEHFDIKRTGGPILASIINARNSFQGYAFSQRFCLTALFSIIKILEKGKVLYDLFKRRNNS